MKLFIRVREAEIVPRGYGFCFHHYNSMSATFAVVPLNLVVAAAHWFWWTLKGIAFISDFERFAKIAHTRGWNEGNAAGFRRGMEEVRQTNNRVVMAVTDLALDAMRAEREARKD